MAEHGWYRAARATLFAVVCVSLTTLGHVLMSGTPLPWWAVAGAFGSVWACGWWLAGYERDIASITAVTVAAQAVLHQGFTFTEMVSPVNSVHAHLASSSGHHHGLALGEMLQMFSAHLVVASLSGLWLAYGERAVFGAIRCAAQRVYTSFALASRPSAALWLPRIKLGRAFRAQTLQQARLVHAIISRGPPPWVAVV
ncbi:hypothetical protein [Kribbella sp. CA-293567]|uniref:hypothetical protein n=1 Tax=Kribbella sp. CA-293567 TaxID=3002436 RepID=UPI0022DD0FA4|nr:hypothetical protein [Kribbella sp. CA-293567]WBQ03432.1 hypothetical protein OX958_26085 [Kribbella sp. CA-293567]